MDSIQRKILVCAKNQCQRCKPDSRVVPETCPWAILHPLDTKTGGTQERARRSGKTTELVEMANDLVAAGYQVYYLTENKDMVDHIRSVYRADRRIRVLTMIEAFKHLRMMSPGLVLADEITAEVMDQIKREILIKSGHLLLAHYWTPRS